MSIDFVWPVALYLLLLVPLIAFAMRRGAAHRGRADALYGGGVDLRLGRSSLLRGLRATLFLIALVLLIVGIARPRWGEAETLLEQRGIDLVIAVDVSRSMEAPDVAPSRAEAVVEGLRGMLPHMQGNRVGMIIFGESAFERSPLTLDIGAISTLLGRAQAESALVDPGTSLAVAIEAGLEVLDVADPAHAQAIIIASDGEDLSGIPFEPALEAAQERGIPVYGLFVGSDAPAVLPEMGGQEDVTTADRSTMELLAAVSGTTVREPGNAAGMAVEFRRMRQTAFATDLDEARVERFAWFIGAGLVVLVVQAMVPEASGHRRTRPRRGVIAAGVGGILLVGCAGTAVWQAVDSGNRAYDEARFEDALASYLEAAERDGDGDHIAPIEYNTSNALHQLQRYDEAIERALAGLEVDSDVVLREALRYSLGNHYFQLGDLERARDAYIATLRLDPTDREAKANLELVLQALTEEEPPAEEPPPPDGMPGPGEPNGEGEGNGEGEQPGDEGEPAPNGEGAEGAEGPDNGPPPPGGEGGAPNGQGPQSPEEARELLDSLLGELGDELTPGEAQALLERYQRLSELDRLPGTAPNQGGPPPR